MAGGGSCCFGEQPTGVKDQKISTLTQTTTNYFGLNTKKPFVPEYVKTEFERSLKKLHILSIPVSFCSLVTESSFFPKCSTRFQEQETDIHLTLSCTSTGLPDRCRALGEHLWGKKKDYASSCVTCQVCKVCFDLMPNSTS